MKVYINHKSTCLGLDTRCTSTDQVKVTRVENLIKHILENGLLALNQGHENATQHVITIRPPVLVGYFSFLDVILVCNFLLFLVPNIVTCSLNQRKVPFIFHLTFKKAIGRKEENKA